MTKRLAKQVLASEDVLPVLQMVGWLEELRELADQPEAYLERPLTETLATQGLASEDVVLALQTVNPLEELEKLADQPEALQAFLERLLTEMPARLG